MLLNLNWMKVSKTTLIDALVEATTRNPNFNKDEWSLFEAEQLEGIANLIKEEIGRESSVIFNLTCLSDHCTLKQGYCHNLKVAATSPDAYTKNGWIINMWKELFVGFNFGDNKLKKTKIKIDDICRDPRHKKFNGKKCACVNCHPLNYCVDDPCMDCDGPVKKRCDPPEELHNALKEIIWPLGISFITVIIVVSL